MQLELRTLGWKTALCVPETASNRVSKGGLCKASPGEKTREPNHVGP